MQADSTSKGKWSGQTKTGCHWETVYGQRGIDSLSQRWDALAHVTADSPTADAIWLGCFWRAFGQRDEDLAIHTLSDGPRLIAVLPLRASSSGLPTWASIENAHTPCCAYALDEAVPGLGDEVLSHLLSSAEALELAKLELDGHLCRSLIEAARAMSLHLSVVPSDPDLPIKLFRPWEEFRLSLPARMRRETARKLRQLERLGRLDFELVESESGLADALQSCFDLEPKGWKGRTGSPIKSSQQTIKFYTELAHRSAAVGRFALYLLRLDGRLIAYEYSLRAQGRIDMLKPSFDPDFAAYSPGNVLRYLVLEYEVARGLVTSYHLGRVSDWKLHWSKQTRPLGRLRVYGDSTRARLAWLMGPRLRSAAKRRPWLRKGIQRAKALLRFQGS